MKKENRILVKYFVLIFLISVLIINWLEISWLFNYKAIFGLVSSAFESKIIAKSSDIFEKKELPAPLKNFEPSDKENSLEIPKIEVSVPLVFPENQKEKDLYKLLDKGVVHFPNSALPGEAGQTIILGHSAPPYWPKIKYDWWIFTRLDELEEGDEIFIYFNHQKYTFSVAKKIFLDKGEEVPKLLTSSENVLVLISCWPPGKNIRRIAVMAIPYL